MKEKTESPKTPATEKATRTRRTSSERFFDAAKGYKSKIAALEEDLDAARKDYTQFVEQAKAALEL